MYWRPVTQMRSALPPGGFGASELEATKTGVPAERPLGPAFWGVSILPSIANVTTARTTRTRAAPTVQPISRLVLPWICAAVRALLALDLPRHQTSGPLTITRITTAIARMIL